MALSSAQFSVLWLVCYSLFGIAVQWQMCLELEWVAKELNEGKCNETPSTCNLSMDAAQKRMGMIIKYVINVHS